MTPLPTLPPDFAWRQSTITAYLRCPRRVYLEHVLQLPSDHALDGYAAITGSALHEVIAHVVHHLDLSWSREALGALLDDAFVRALQAAQYQGATTDPERVGPALERLQGEQLELVVALAEDPRLRAVEWRGIEEEFELVDQHGRRFQGHIDLWGVARERVQFGQASRGEPAWLNPGDVALIDWKTGTETALDWTTRAINVQLGFYSSVRLAGLGNVRAFIGNLRDLRRPKLPKDERGESIPRHLEEVNPAWAAAVGIDPADRAAIEACRKRPKDAGPKWIKRENPAWLEATSRPAGPLFHECRIDYGLVSCAIEDAIDGARFGLWPPSGATNGECPRCPFRTRCTHQEGAGA